MTGPHQLRYAYYPGCASQAMTKEANDTTRRVADMLGIELHDMPRASCCGAGLLTDYDYNLYLALNARILAQAEQMGMDIMTICSTCLTTISSANRDLKNDPDLLKKTNALIGKTGITYGGTVKVKLLSWVLLEDYGLKRLKSKIKVPLTRLKVAPFYGCHSLRPSDALGFDNPEDPSSLEDIIDAVGAEPVWYEGRIKCCGFQVDLVSEDAALELTGKRLLDAKKMGAHCMVTPCPFCHINLDSYQSLAEKKFDTNISMPVFHLAQLVGISMGMNASEAGLTRHMVSAMDVLESAGI